MEQVQPSLAPISYSHEMPHDVTHKTKNSEFESKNPDELLLKEKSKVLSFINNLRSRVSCIDKCLMVLGIFIFFVLAIVSFILALPLMIWIAIGWFGMVFSAAFVLCLRAYCPRSIYNVMIDVFHIPHTKT